MMKRFMRILAVSVVAAFMAGCVYTSIRMPMDKDYEKTELGTREGHSNIHTILWLVSWGDGGTRAAAGNGGIKIIRHADREVFNLLFGVYSRITTVVYGD